MGKAKAYLAVVERYEQAPEWDFVAVDKATREIVRKQTFTAHDPAILGVLESWEAQGYRLGFHGSDVTQSALIRELGGTVMAVPADDDLLGQLKDGHPKGPWALLAFNVRTQDYQQGYWVIWNRKSMQRWIKLYEGLGYEILLPVPGTNIYAEQRP